MKFLGQVELEIGFAGNADDLPPMIMHDYQEMPDPFDSGGDKPKGLAACLVIANNSYVACLGRVYGSVIQIAVCEANKLRDVLNCHERWD